MALVVFFISQTRNTLTHTTHGLGRLLHFPDEKYTQPMALLILLVSCGEIHTRTQPMAVFFIAQTRNTHAHNPL